MAQIAKKLNIRKDGVVTQIPLYSSTGDTSGNYMTLKVDGSPAYAQLVPASGGYGGSSLHVKKSGTEYLVATVGMPPVQEYSGNPGFSITAGSGNPNDWVALIAANTIYVPRAMNVAIYAYAYISYSSNAGQGGFVDFYIDSTNYYHSYYITPGHNAYVYMYSGSVSLAAGAHTLSTYGHVITSFGDYSTMSCSAILMRGTLNQA
jgi:hypothetical protein